MEDEIIEEETSIDLTPQPKGGMKPLTIIGSLLGVLALAAAILIVADPFGLNVLARLRGEYDPAIRVMPMDTIAYAQINLLEANVTELTDLVETFQSVLPTPTEEEETDTPPLEQEIGETSITANDLLSWAGQYAGIGVLDVKMDGEMIESAEWLAAFEVRNEENANAFLEKLISEWKESSDLAEVRTQTVQELTVTIFEEGENVVMMTIHDGLMLVSGSIVGIETALETLNGRSLADDVNYIETISYLTSDPFITGYVNTTRMYDFVNESMTEEQLEFFEATYGDAWEDGLRGLAIRLSIVEAGILLEYGFAYNAETMPEEQLAMIQLGLSDIEESVNRIPNDTIAYMVMPNLAFYWESFRTGMLQTMDEEELEESLDLAAEQMGIRPDTDFLALLDQDTSFIVRGQQVEDISDLTITGIMGSSQADTLATNLATFRDAFSDPETGMGTVAEETAGDITLYGFESVFLPESKIYYSIHQENLIITNKAEGVTELAWNGENNITSNAYYQEANQVLGSTPMMFVDMKQIFESVLPAESVEDDVADVMSIFNYASTAYTETEGEAIVVKFLIGIK